MREVKTFSNGCSVAETVGESGEFDFSFQHRNFVMDATVLSRHERWSSSEDLSGGA